MRNSSTRTGVAVLAITAIAMGRAYASDPDTNAHSLLTSMHSAVVAGESERAIDLGKQAKKVLLASTEPVPAHVQGGLAMVQGSAWWSIGEQDTAMEAWRAALRVAPQLAWDPDLPTTGDADAVFEALRREVRSRPTTVVGVPADLGATQLYVAGQPATPELALAEGSYLVQAACPDGVLRSRWWKSSKPLKAERSCPGGLGEATVVADQGCSGPAFDAFGNPVDPCEGTGVAQGD